MGVIPTRKGKLVQEMCYRRQRILTEVHLILYFSVTRTNWAVHFENIYNNHNPTSPFPCKLCAKTIAKLARHAKVLNTALMGVFPEGLMWLSILRNLELFGSHNSELKPEKFQINKSCFCCGMPLKEITVNFDTISQYLALWWGWYEQFLTKYLMENICI